MCCLKSHLWIHKSHHFYFIFHITTYRKRSKFICRKLVNFPWHKFLNVALSLSDSVRNVHELIVNQCHIGKLGIIQVLYNTQFLSSSKAPYNESKILLVSCCPSNKQIGCHNYSGPAIWRSHLEDSSISNIS